MSNPVLSGNNLLDADTDACRDSGPVSIGHQRIVGVGDSTVTPIVHTKMAESDQEDKRDTIPSPPPIEEVERSPH